MAASFWHGELERADREERGWRKRAEKVIERYRDERDDRVDESTRFNILWANTETLRPSLISDTPRPEVRRRYKKPSPVARIGAKIIERALEFGLDNMDFTTFGRTVVNDYLLAGRGAARVKYIPTFEKKKKRTPLKMQEVNGETIFTRGDEVVSEAMFDEQGAFLEEDVEELVFEEWSLERIPWKWLRIDPADSWENVRWVAFGKPFTKDELVDDFGTKGAAVEVNSKESKAGTEQSESMKGKVIVWEIWDRRTRKQIFIAEEHDEILEENDDPLGLEDFFPMPAPIYAVEDNDTMVPTPEFCLYQDQADELDELTARIYRITQAIKARGAYAGEKKVELSQILDADDNQLVPVEDWVTFAEKGGLDGIISWVPVEQFAKVLNILERERASKIQQIFELTGVSDIQRGVTDPRETARAASLKANFGNRRLLTKQQSVQNFFRDLLRIAAELVSEQFDPNTLKLMVGLESENELFDEAVKLIKSDALRLFNIDIETDSTIAPDVDKERESLSLALEAIASYASQVFPLVQTGAVPMPAAMEILRRILRTFRLGRELDEVLDEMAKQQQQQKPDPEAEKAKAELQLKQQEAQIKMQFDMQKMQADLQKMRAELQMDSEEHQQEIRQDEEKHQQELRQDRELASVKAQNERELGKVRQDVQRQQNKTF